MTLNEMAAIVVDVAYWIHKTYGPGLLESAYEAIMEHLLTQRGLVVERQVAIPLVVKGVPLNETAYKADLIINDRLIIELKSVSELHNMHKKQLLTYLRLADKRLGLLINFGASLLKNNIERIVNGELD
jgi:GxxExxY protein